MASIKRKFTVAPEDDDVLNSSNGLSGKSVFQKYRTSASVQNDVKSNQCKQPQTINKNSSNQNQQLLNSRKPSEQLTIIKDSKTSPDQNGHVLEKKSISNDSTSSRLFGQTSSFQKNDNINYNAPPQQIQPSDTVIAKKNKNSIIVSSKQRGNPILKHIRNVPWEYGEIVPDYQIGATSCALFLSLRYHNINPEYIHERIKQLGKSFELRLILVQVDVKDSRHAMKELARIAMLSDFTLICAWSAEEAGRYLETYKQYENKPAEALQERVEPGFDSKMTDCLTSIKSVNKTDVITLIATFGSLKNISLATKEEISLCPGIGPQKAERLINAFREPFKRRVKISRDVDSSGKNPNIVT